MILLGLGVFLYSLSKDHTAWGHSSLMRWTSLPFSSYSLSLSINRFGVRLEHVFVGSLSHLRVVVDGKRILHLFIDHLIVHNKSLIHR